MTSAKVGRGRIFIGLPLCAVDRTLAGDGAVYSDIGVGAATEGIFDEFITAFLELETSAEDRGCCNLSVE